MKLYIIGIHYIKDKYSMVWEITSDISVAREVYDNLLLDSNTEKQPWYEVWGKVNNNYEANNEEI